MANAPSPMTVKVRICMLARVPVLSERTVHTVRVGTARKRFFRVFSLRHPPFGSFIRRARRQRCVTHLAACGTPTVPPVPSNAIWLMSEGGRASKAFFGQFDTLSVARGCVVRAVVNWPLLWPMKRSGLFFGLFRPEHGAALWDALVIATIRTAFAHSHTRACVRYVCCCCPSAFSIQLLCVFLCAFLY